MRREEHSAQRGEPMRGEEHCAQRGAPTMEGRSALCAEGCTYHGREVYYAQRGVPTKGREVYTHHGAQGGVYPPWCSGRCYTQGCTKVYYTQVVYPGGVLYPGGIPRWCMYPGMPPYYLLVYYPGMPPYYTSLYTLGIPPSRSCTPGPVHPAAHGPRCASGEALGSVGRNPLGERPLRVLRSVNV